MIQLCVNIFEILLLKFLLKPDGSKLENKSYIHIKVFNSTLDLKNNTSI